MTYLWLVRHGQTDWNAEGRYQGQADPPLNAAGRAQAEGVAALLAGQAFAALCSSDLQRARETAQIAGRLLGLTATLDPRWREINLGDWEGLRVEEIVRRYPREWSRRLKNPLHARAPGGESLAQVAARTQAAADSAARAHPGGRVLVVSHAVAMATLRCRARGRPLAEAYDLPPVNGSIEVIAWTVR